MGSATQKEREEKVSLSIEIAIKLGLLAVVIYFTYLIAKPFMVILFGVLSLQWHFRH